MLCAKFGLKCPSGSGEEDFKKFSRFHYFAIEKVSPDIWKENLNQLHARILCAKFGWKSPKGSGEEVFKSFQCIFAFSLLSPHWIRRCPLFKQTWIIPTLECFVTSLAKLGPVVLEKKMKMWRKCRQTHRRQMDGRRSTGDQENSLELSAQVN